MKIILNAIRELLIVVIGVLIACALLLIMAGGAMEIGEWVRTL